MKLGVLLLQWRWVLRYLLIEEVFYILACSLACPRSALSLANSQCLNIVPICLPGSGRQQHWPVFGRGYVELVCYVGFKLRSELRRILRL